MKTSSAKAKGRRLQKAVATLIAANFSLPESDIKSLPMGSQGCDVWLSEKAREKFPFAIECKNVEKLNVWESFEQAKMHAVKENLAPLLVFSRNRSDILVCLTLTDLLKVMSELKTTV